jgi:DNA modification methylase
VKKGSRTSKFGTTSRISHESSSYYASKLYADLQIAQGRGEPDQEFPPELLDQIIPHSSTRMPQIPDNSLHLMVTSPPYNVSKLYDGDLTLRAYLGMLHRVMKETYRVLVWGGRACINIANVGRKPYIALSDHISAMMTRIGFAQRGEVIWSKGAGAGVSMAWGSFASARNPVLRDTHEYILIFSKGTFARKRPEGKDDTISKEQFMEWTKSVWTMQPESARKVGHPAPFPVELPYRLIQLCTFSNDIVLDPFMGSGSTALAAIKSRRHFVGYEIDRDYVKLAKERIVSFKY